MKQTINGIVLIKQCSMIFPDNRWTRAKPSLRNKLLLWY